MDKELVQIADGKILAQYGPMRLNIETSGLKGPDSKLARAAGEYSFTLLPRLAPAIKLFRRDLQFSEVAPIFDDHLLNRMVTAVKSVDWRDLGPMAAVAGVVADEVAFFLKNNGAVRAIVENGGDVAIYLAPGQTAAIGVKLKIEDEKPSYKMILTGESKPFWGVCTSSGQGGRGLSQGLADAAMCVGTSAAIADAAATALGNACWVDSPKVRQVKAEELRPDTDIPGLLVTESVGALTCEEIQQAIVAAMSYAQSLVDKNIILGGLISLSGRVAHTADFGDKIAELQPC